VPKPSDQPNLPDKLDLSFDYPVGTTDRFTITCKTSEGTGSMPAPWAGLMTLLPPPRETHQVTVGETLRFTIPGVNATTVAITVTKPS